MPTQSILCDIEGTTTSIAFAKEVLFPLSFREMEPFIRQNWSNPEISKDLAAVREELRKMDPQKRLDQVSEDEVIQILRSWIVEDRKATALKSIQGKIWKESFESGRLRGHVYPDVPPAFQQWAALGIQLDIFSSGSIEAQKLVFKFSEAGDLSPYISRYFDTTTGPKKEAASYLSIAKQIGRSPSSILFLSDAPDELDAASTAGFDVLHVIRDGGSSESTSPFRAISSFDQIKLQ
jgi:enolase-phosphatase E1